MFLMMSKHHGYDKSLARLMSQPFKLKRLLTLLFYDFEKINKFVNTAGKKTEEDTEINKSPKCKLNKS